MTTTSEPAETTPIAGGAPELHRQIEQLQAEIAASREEIERLHQDVHRWWSVADQYRHELLALYASRSWRITAPLRLLAKFLSGVRRSGTRDTGLSRASSLLHVMRSPRSGAKAIVRWAIRRVLVTPWLKARAEMLLSGHPRFRQRLRHLLVTDSAAGSSELVRDNPQPTPRRSEFVTEGNFPGTRDNPASRAGMPLEERLSPRAASVYVELRQSLAARER